MIVFPLGPQQARLWHPGLMGIASLVAAFPLAAFVGGLFALQARRLPSSPRTLAVLAVAASLPGLFSTDHASFLCARLLSGLAAGVSYVAIHRVWLTRPGSARLAARVVAFGLPPSLLAATLYDWRADFAPLLLGFGALTLLAPHRELDPLPRTRLTLPGPYSLFATGALAFVSAALLTVLSGFLVYNAGQTELHISAVLLVGALLGLGVPPALRRLQTHAAPAMVFTTALAASALSLVSLLLLRGPLPGALAVGLIACFFATNSARHPALAALVAPQLSDLDRPAHQTHTHLAHHLGSGLGALCAGGMIHIAVDHRLTGLSALVALALVVTGLAYATGLLAAQPSTAPAARAADAKILFRVATSLVRSVRTSITRTPGSPT